MPNRKPTTPPEPASDEHGEQQELHEGEPVRSPAAASNLRVVTPADGSIMCHFCGGAKFRRSRIQVDDIPELLMLRYPLRCMRCNQRQYGYLLTASLAHAGKTYR